MGGIRLRCTDGNADWEVIIEYVVLLSAPEQTCDESERFYFSWMMCVVGLPLRSFV